MMIGRTIAHYRILEKLGQGGMGVVYKARDVHLDRLVAIKVLQSAATADSKRKRRLIHEARAASALNHPHIVTGHDFASEGGLDFIVMEYVAGRTLKEMIERSGRSTRHAPFSTAGGAQEGASHGSGSQTQK